MSTVKEGLKYTKEHEWVQVLDDGTAIVGITDFAQSELGELVFIEVDTIGDTLSQGDIFGTVEAVKTTSDLFIPLDGEVLEFNSALQEGEGDNPGLINEDPYGDGWIIKMRIADPDQIDSLLDHATYSDLIS